MITPGGEMEIIYYLLLYHLYEMLHRTSKGNERINIDV